MTRSTPPRRPVPTIAVGLALSAALIGAIACKPQAAPAQAPTANGCPGDNGGLSLPAGFCATVFADKLGQVRHMAFGPGGVLYVNSWSGSYFPGSAPPVGGFLIALKDSDGDGRADEIKRFGATVLQGDAGGSGVAVYGGYVYAETNDKIVRYALPPGGGAPTGEAQVVLSGMPLGGDHPMHPFIIGAKGDLFVDMGTATNSCQPRNRAAEVPGAQPCIEKETRGGVWLYDANKLGQAFSPKERYISGVRNGEGLAFDADGRLFATQHGRDQLPENWPKLYPDKTSANELPAEELVQLTRGADYGWPECYYDGGQKTLVLAPEYGGDGGKTVGLCAQRNGPVAAFPAHWAPNDLAIYTAQAFPTAYRGGAFIAFHGSWNRAPAPQGGYNVVFQPLANGQASGPYTVFADGFAGPHRDPRRAVYRPTGLAVGPDGALYISDDVAGRIWRVTYHGPADAAAVSATPAATAQAAAAPAAQAPLPVPPGSSREQVAAGDTVFHAQGCASCHGPDAKGSPIAPDLTAGHWLWSDGSLAALKATIDKGVPAPKQYRSPMPARGGAPLSDQQLADVAAYVWAVGHQGH
jgi:glucose/arabinose dehydrogenase/cytochrome c553